MFKNYGKKERSRIKGKDNTHRKMPRHRDNMKNPETIYRFYKYLRKQKLEEANQYREKLLSTITKAERAFQFILTDIGIDFEREYIVLLRDYSTKFIDFYCDSAKIGFEIDGGYHKDRMEYDIDRDIGIMSMNILMVRFINEKVLEDPEDVKAKIYETMWSRVDWWNKHNHPDRMAEWINRHR